MAGIFKRVEKKYLLTSEQRKLLIERLGERIEDDIYSDYTISNIYYDTESNDLIRRSLAKPRFKEKFRLRCYGEASEESNVFLELKKKWRGVVYKRRVGMPLKVAERYLEEHIYPVDYDCQILKEIDYAIGFYRLVPKVFLAYDRKAYVVKDMPEIRFTLDERIRSRKTDIDLKKGSDGDLLYSDNMMLLEIKAPAALPLWFVDILAELDIYSTSFSKYGRVYESLLKTDLEQRDEESGVRTRYTMQQLECDSAKNRSVAPEGVLT